MFYVEHRSHFDGFVRVPLEDLTLEEAYAVARNYRAVGFTDVTVKHEEGTATVLTA